MTDHAERLSTVPVFLVGVDEPDAAQHSMRFASYESARDHVWSFPGRTDLRIFQVQARIDWATMEQV